MSEHAPEPADIPEAPDDLDFTAFLDIDPGAAVGDVELDEHEPGYVATDDHVEDDLVYVDGDGEEVTRP